MSAGKTTIGLAVGGDVNDLTRSYSRRAKAGDAQVLLLDSGFIRWFMGASG